MKDVSLKYKINGEEFIFPIISYSGVHKEYLEKGLQKDGSLSYLEYNGREVFSTVDPLSAISYGAHRAAIKKTTPQLIVINVEKNIENITLPMDDFKKQNWVLFRKLNPKTFKYFNLKITDPNNREIIDEEKMLYDVEDKINETVIEFLNSSISYKDIVRYFKPKKKTPNIFRRYEY